jgi:peroxiredoxin Q/BCP
LPFTLLVDTDHKIAEMYGAWGEKALKERMYVGIFRSHFIVDENGKIVDVQIGIKPDDSVMKALESITRS